MRIKTEVFKTPLLLVAFSCLLASCVSHPTKISPARGYLISGDCQKATEALLNLSNEPSTDQLLYLMEYGSALQICKDYKKSNEVFLRADKLSEEIDYISASRVVGATLMNEEMLQYKGDVFEKLFINISAAINFIELEQFDEAMVEVRRINDKYNKFSAEEKNSFELNSFSQYLAGLIYEADKKYDDACISYKAAYQLDRSYYNVALDLLTACWRAKRSQEFEKLLKEIQPTPEELKFIKRKDQGEKIIVYMQGFGPKKAPRPDHPIYPYLVPTYNETKSLRVSFFDAEKKPQTKNSHKVYSVEKAAIATQEADYKALQLRRFGSRIAKEVVADQFRQKNKALGDIAWLVMVASEKADLRNWTLLPESMQILRFTPDLNTKIKIVGLNSYDVESEILPELDFSQNKKKKIYFIRTIR